jgi:ComF family protein
MNLSTFKKALLPTLRKYLSPPRCEACQKIIDDDHELCEDCEKSLQTLSPSHCEICALPFNGAELSKHCCVNCLKDPPSFNKVHALYEFEGSLPELLRAGKFGKRLKIYHLLAQRGALYFRKVVEEFQPHYLVPMPLSWRRRWVRGFNQSYLLAKYLVNKEDEKYSILLRTKRKHTPPQAQRSREERLRALKGVFSLINPEKVKDKKLLLIDDIMTTGATVQALSKEFKKAGAAEIRVFVIARVGRYF